MEDKLIREATHAEQNEKIFEAYKEVLGVDEMRGDSQEVSETSNEKKEQMYYEGLRTIRSAFYIFSQEYMKGMGLMMQGKKAVDPKWKKSRDKIATSYERLDDAITDHDKKLSDQIAKNLKNKRI